MLSAARERLSQASRKTRPIRVASVPEGHVYVRHLAPTTCDDNVVRLADPPPRETATVAGQWWPPAMLDPRWIREHAAEFDVFHVHFGFDALSADDLRAVLDELDRCDKPLIYTVHDLRNPHHVQPGAHAAHLDLLLQRAAALITLTPGAAEAVERRWQRRPRVLPHPHVVEFARMQRGRSSDPDTFTVGVHAKSVRPSMDPQPVLAALLPLVAELPGLRVQVNIHHDVADPDGERHDAVLMRFLRHAAEQKTIDLQIHDCFSDDELWDYLQSLDLSVLPYRFGTHSGWLEACHDLGTAVLAPTCGFFAQQRRCLTYRHDETTFDPVSLRAAVRTAYEQRPRWRADAEQRLAERNTIAQAHRELYEAVLR